MNVLVRIFEGADVTGVLRDGPRHPVLGGLIDVGSCARLDGCDATVVARCAQSSPAVRLDRATGPLLAADRAGLEACAAAEPLFIVLLGAGEAAVIAAGPDLPAMGMMPDCDAGRFAGSLRFAAGEQVADSLFAEPDPGWDGEGARDLTERLRQLYGQ